MFTGEVVHFFRRQAAHRWIARSYHKCSGHLATTVLQIHTGDSDIGNSGMLEQDTFNLSWGDLPSIKRQLVSLDRMMRNRVLV
jgi:hypothetical protein